MTKVEKVYLVREITMRRDDITNDDWNVEYGRSVYVDADIIEYFLEKGKWAFIDRMVKDGWKIDKIHDRTGSVGGQVDMSRGNSRLSYGFIVKEFEREE